MYMLINLKYATNIISNTNLDGGSTNTSDPWRRESSYSSLRFELLTLDRVWNGKIFHKQAIFLLACFMKLN